MPKIRKTIGPNFAQELVDAGLGNGIAWNNKGVQYDDTLTEAEVETLKAVVQKHDRTTPRTDNRKQERKKLFQDIETILETPHNQRTKAAVDDILNKIKEIGAEGL